MTDAAPAAAVSWSATMGLVPGYGHDNPEALLAERRALLVRLWDEAMEEAHARTRFSVSCVMTDSLVLYRRDGGCPEGGERAVTLTGSSNPRYVRPDEIGAFREAVEDVVRRVQIGMGQTSCRIEFSHVAHSVYSRIEPTATQRRTIRDRIAERYRHALARLGRR